MSEVTKQLAREVRAVNQALDHIDHGTAIAPESLETLIDLYGINDPGQLIARISEIHNELDGENSTKKETPKS